MPIVLIVLRFLAGPYWWSQLGAAATLLELGPADLATKGALGRLAFLVVAGAMWGLFAGVSMHI